jgi:hypothetical protein
MTTLAQTIIQEGKGRSGDFWAATGWYQWSHTLELPAYLVNKDNYVRDV